MTPTPRGHLIQDHVMAGTASILEELCLADEKEYAAAFTRIAQRLEATLVSYEQKRRRQLKRLGPVPPPSEN